MNDLPILPPIGLKESGAKIEKVNKSQSAVFKILRVLRNLNANVDILLSARLPFRVLDECQEMNGK